MTIQKIAIWIPMTDEALADAPYVRASYEYMTSPEAERPAEGIEIVTGWRSFTSSEGVTVQFRVGWRLALYRMLQEFAREAWPEDYAEDEC